MTISDQPQQNDVIETESKKCINCNTHPNTFSQTVCNTCIECMDTPDMGHPNYKPGSELCKDCAICCMPLVIVADIVCIIPMCLGLFEVKPI